MEGGEDESADEAMRQWDKFFSVQYVLYPA